MLRNKEERIQTYINRAKDSIKAIRQKKRIKRVEKLIPQIKKIRGNLENKLGIQGQFLISSDYPQDDEDINILKKVLEIDEKIVYLTDDIEKIKELKKLFPDRVFEVDEDLYLLAFVVDVHIYFRDRKLYQLLEKNGRNFWPMHPKDTPVQKGIELPENLKNNIELMKFLFGNKYKEIKNRIDNAKFWFGDVLNEKELKKFANSSGIEHFYYTINLSVKNKDFLKKLFFQRKKSYEYKVFYQYSKNNIYPNKDFKSNLNIKNFLKAIYGN